MTTIDLETFKAYPEIMVHPALLPEMVKLETTTPQALYEQGMKHIWETVSQLPEGQDKVVLSQMWVFGKTYPKPTPKDFPALATHGFIVEQLVEGQAVWKPSSPYLRDFWQVGIHVSSAFGFSLQAHRAFQANLQARIQIIVGTVGMGR